MSNATNNRFFETATIGAVAYLCDDDRYCPELNAFESRDEFNAMCEESFGTSNNDAGLIEVVLGGDGVWRGGQYAVRIADGASVTHI